MWFLGVYNDNFGQVVSFIFRRKCAFIDSSAAIPVMMRENGYRTFGHKKKRKGAGFESS